MGLSALSGERKRARWLVTGVKRSRQIKEQRKRARWFVTGVKRSHHVTWRHVRKIFVPSRARRMVGNSSLALRKRKMRCGIRFMQKLGGRSLV